MKLQKIQLNRTLLTLCSLVVILILLSGCKNEGYITYQRFYELVSEAYGIEESNDSSNYIPVDEIIYKLEELSNSTITYPTTSKYIKEKDCIALIRLSMDLYLQESTEIKDEVVIKEEIIDISEYATQVGDHQYSIYNLQLLPESYVYIKEGNQKVIQKIEEVKGNIIITSDVEIEDIIDEIHIDEDVEINKEDIQLEEGVEVIPTTSTSSKGFNLSLKVHFLKNNFELSSDFASLLGLDHSLEIGKEWEIIHTKQFKDLSISLDPLTFSREYVEKHAKDTSIPIHTSKYKSGYEVDGELTISNIQLHPAIDYQDGKMNRCVVDFSYEFESKLKYKGKIEKDLKIATIQVPVGSSGVSVTCILYLNLNANGEMNLTYQLADHTKCEYNEGKFKRVNTHTTTFTGDASMKFLGGPKVSLDLFILGARITNFDLYTQAELKNGGKLIVDEQKEAYQIYLSYGSDVYLPIIKLKMGSKASLSKSLGITFESKVVSEKNAYHYEIYHHKILIYECSKEGIESNQGILNISDYILYLDLGQTSELQIISIPEGYDQDDIVVDLIGDSIIYKDGMIQAIKEGNSTLHFHTKDDHYQVDCNVYVGRSIKEEESG